MNFCFAELKNSMEFNYIPTFESRSISYGENGEQT